MNLPLYLFCALAIFGSLSLVFARHPIRGSMGLLLTMASLSGIFGILEAHLISAFQIIIYAGAIMILIVYVIMLLDIKTESYFKRYSNLKTISFVLVGFISFLSLIALGKLDQGNLPTVVENFGSVKEVSKKLISTYLLSFEIASMILLVGVIATIALVNRDAKESP